MKVQGYVRNGEIVLEGGRRLPEGARVTVVCDQAPAPRESATRYRVELPLVRSRRPGALRLTAEDVAAALEEDDVAP